LETLYIGDNNLIGLSDLSLNTALKSLATDYACGNAGYTPVKVGMTFFCKYKEEVCPLAVGELNVDITVSETTLGKYDLNLEYYDDINTSLCFDVLSSVGSACSNHFTGDAIINETGCYTKTKTVNLLELLDYGFEVQPASGTIYVVTGVVRTFVNQSNAGQLRGQSVGKTIEFSRKLDVNIETQATFTSSGVDVYPNQTVEQVTTAVTYNRSSDSAEVAYKTVVQSMYLLEADSTTSGAFFDTGTSNTNSEYSFVANLTEDASRTGCGAAINNTVCYQVWSQTIKANDGCNSSTDFDYAFDVDLVAYFDVLRLNTTVNGTNTADDDTTAVYKQVTTVKSGNVCTQTINGKLFEGTGQVIKACNDISSDTNATAFYFGDDICLALEVTLNLATTAVELVGNATFDGKEINSGFKFDCQATGLNSSLTVGTNDTTANCTPTSSLSVGTNYFIYGFKTAALYDVSNNVDTFLATDAALSFTLKVTPLVVTNAPSRRLRKLVETSIPDNNAESFSAVVGSISSRPRPGNEGAVTSELFQGSSSSNGNPNGGAPSWAIALIVIAVVAVSVGLVLKALKSYKSYRAKAKVGQNSHFASSPPLLSMA